MNNTKFALHTDLYQINMAYAYFKDNCQEDIATFEVYFRKNPFNNGHNVFVGIKKVIEVIENYKFLKEDLEYLKSFGLYSQDFLLYLENLKFSGDIYAPKEGELIFAKEPILIVKAPIIEAQLLETIILNIINFQVLIATKASKMVGVTDKPLYEFGCRRAFDTEAAIWGSRASYVAGFYGTSLVESGKRFNIPIVGTHAHSFVQNYIDEYKAFKSYATNHYECTFLVDTYDVLKSGLPNAIKVANELGDKISFNAIRIDSGDLATLTKASRKILDENGYQNVKIMVSNDIDESIIIELAEQEAPIDLFGIGTKLAVCDGATSLGAVYKLVNINKKGISHDVIKLSNSKEKITNPGVKMPYRLYDKDGMALSDVVAEFDETIRDDVMVFNDSFPLGYSYFTIASYRKLLEKVIESGKVIKREVTTKESREYHVESLKEFDKVYLRYSRPELFKVCLSQNINDLKIKLIKENGV